MKNPTEDLNYGLGKTLKALRRMRKMTQQEVGHRAGLTRTSIANIEGGKQMLSARTLAEIADALGFVPEIRFKPKPKPPDPDAM